MMPVKKNHWLPGILSDFFGNDLLHSDNLSSPAVNIMENEREYRVEIAAPGTTREDFRIELQDDNNLMVTMEKRTEKTYDSPEGQNKLNPKARQNQIAQPGDKDAGQEKSAQKTEQKPAGNVAPETDDDNRYLRREFSYSSFRQSMILPDNVKREEIEARVSDGILTIVIPKATEEEIAQKAKTIEIK